MVGCKVNIVEAFNLDWYPGWCKAVLQDSNGVEHILVEKLPVIGLDIEEVSSIPIERYIAVEVVNDFGNMVEINTAVPDGIETEDGETHFVVNKDCIKEL